MLPDPLPDRFLFISAGSGITPIMSMLRALARRDAPRPTWWSCTPRARASDVIFGAELREPGGAASRASACTSSTRRGGPHRARRPRRPLPRLARARGVRQRPRRPCSTRWTTTGSEHGDRDRLHMERFQPIIGSEDAEHGDGGTIRFTNSDVEASSDGATPILVAGEEAGATLPYGCRMGICHTCVGQLCSGPGPRPAHRQGLGLRRRVDPHLRQRPRRPRRDRPVNDDTRGPHGNDDRKPARAAHPRADRRARQGVRRDPRRGVRRARRPRPALHHEHDRDAPPAGGARPDPAAGLAPPAGVDRSARRCSRWPRSSRTWRSATT